MCDVAANDFNPFGGGFDLNPFEGGLGMLFDPLNLYSGAPKRYELRDPGQLDYHENAALGPEVDYLKGKRSEFDAWASQFTDAGRYESLTDKYASRAEIASNNRFSSLGLGGSSAAFGAASEARRSVEEQMLNRQLSDRSAIAGVDQSFSGQISSDIQYIQSLFNNFQAQDFSAFVNEQNAEAAQRAGLLRLIGGGLGAALTQSPQGAQAGANVAGGAAPGQMPMPAQQPSPGYYGTPSYPPQSGGAGYNMGPYGGAPGGSPGYYGDPTYGGGYSPGYY